MILDLESTNQLDTSSADMLDLLLDDLRARDIDLHLVRVFSFVRTVLQRSGFEERLGPDHMWHSISQGVRRARAEAAASDAERAAVLAELGGEQDLDLAERIATHLAIDEDVELDPPEVVRETPTVHRRKGRKHQAPRLEP